VGRKQGVSEQQVAELADFETRAVCCFTLGKTIRRKSKNDGQPTGAQPTQLETANGPDFETSAAFTELEKLVLRYAVEMTRTPVDVPEEVFEGLRRHFQEGQLVELTSAIAWENYRARFKHALGIEAEGFSEGAVCPLPGLGK
jgi:hypothetical protein